ncbi:uncharacterized protein PG986_014391 [Apiospora aurea]|uniref:Uncharacterized protein n=1 Tax=Apiospora aurea TaxID=335848 RepID=A0ABR1PT67_9PEZI
MAIYNCGKEIKAAKGFEHTDTFLKLRDEADPEVRFDVLEELRMRLVEMLAKLFLNLTKRLYRRIREAKDLDCERVPHQLSFARSGTSSKDAVGRRGIATSIDKLFFI